MEDTLNSVSICLQKLLCAKLTAKLPLAYSLRPSLCP